MSKRYYLVKYINKYILLECIKKLERVRNTNTKTLYNI